MVYREGKAAGVLGDPDPARYVGKPLRSCLEDGLPGLVSVVRITSIGRGTTPVRGLTITMVANYLVPDLFAAVQKMYIIWTENELATVAKR